MAAPTTYGSQSVTTLGITTLGQHLTEKTEEEKKKKKEGNKEKIEAVKHDFFWSSCRASLEALTVIKILTLFENR